MARALRTSQQAEVLKRRLLLSPQVVAKSLAERLPPFDLGG